VFIKKTNIYNFRIIKEKEIVFNENKTLIFGNNGVGKTSILECIYLLGFGKSYKEKNHKNLVKYGFSDFSLSCDVNNLNGNYLLGASYKDSMRLFINKKKTNLKDIQKVFFPVFFSSDYCYSLLSSQTEKRKFFNRLIFGMEALYLPQLLSYNQCIYQKNLLLKNNPNIKDIACWNKVLSEMANFVTVYRLNFVENLNSLLASIYGKSVFIHYVPSIPHENVFSVNETYNFLNYHFKIEAKTKFCVFGPHRDKFFFVNALDKDIATNSSGERKLFFLLIFLTYCELFKSVRGEYPLFLIDDFDTALDENNKGFFLSAGSSMQIIATSVNNNKYFDYSMPMSKGD
jgi:DNA replication and repair protein RecF